MATTTMKTMNTTTGTILLPPTPPQTPPLEARKPSPTTFTLSPSLPASYDTFGFEKTPQPPKPSTLTLLSPALGLPTPHSTTFAFEKAPPPSQPSQSLLAASSRLSALGWKSRPRQGPQGDCRQLQKPNRSLAIPTLLPGGVPAVVVHGPKCECRTREEKTEKDGDDELVARVLAVAQSSVVRERIEEQRRIKEKRRRAEDKRERSTERKGRKSVFGWKVEIPKEVSRFFSGSTTSLSDSDSESTSTSTTGSDHHKITDLCLACSNLDIDKIVVHLFTNMVPINGRCTITSSESEDAQPVETTPLFSVLRSPLFATRPEGQIAILRLLLDLGADPNTSVSVLPLSLESTYLSGQSQPGRITILSAACILGLPEAVSLLLERGAKVDARETSLPLGVDGKWGKVLSAVDVAIMAGQEAIVEVLLRSGANVTGSCELFLPALLPTSKLAGTIGGRPRLRSASTANFHSRHQQQQQEHSQPQWPSPLPIQRKTTRLAGVTPLHLTSLATLTSSSSSPSSNINSLALASMLLSTPYSKPDTNARTSSSSSSSSSSLNGGRTPLHYAAESLNLEVSSLLLSDPRTDPDATDDDGATPLALLVGRLERVGCGSCRATEEVVELVRRLLRAGASAGVRYGTDLSLKGRLLAFDAAREGEGEDNKWRELFEEDGRGVLRGSVKRRTF